jgi:hypothetical protein
MIMVATRRNAVNDSPSIVIGDDVIVSGGQQPIDTPDPEGVLEDDDFAFRHDSQVRLPFPKTPAPALSSNQHAPLPIQ